MINQNEHRIKVGSRLPGATMANAFRPGDPVEWRSRQGKIEGKVVKTVTKPTQIKGFTARASVEDPRIEVQSDKTGNAAIHKPGELKRATKESPRAPKRNASDKAATKTRSRSRKVEGTPSSPKRKMVKKKRG